MKKLLVMFLSLIMAVNVVIPAYANEVETEFMPTGLYEEQAIISDYEMPASEIDAHSDLSEEEVLFLLEDMVKEALLNGDTWVDISSHKIKSEEHPWVLYLKCFSPYFSNGIDIATFMDMSGDYYYGLELKNNMDTNETYEYFESVDEKKNEILSLLSEDYNDMKNALIMHDYLVHECEYDVAALENGSSVGFEDSFRSGGIIMTGVGVCQAYAFAYKYFLNLVGMEVYFNPSNDMGHAWNIVNIDGQYYHVDATYDDPIPDRAARVSHGNFLNSDARMIEKGYHGWRYNNIKCISTQYDTFFVKNITSQIIIDGDKYYYITDDGFVRSNSDGTGYELLDKLTLWFADGGGVWSGKFSGIVRYKDSLYYNNDSEIIKYNLETGNKQIIYIYNNDNYDIYGIVIKNNSLMMNIKETPNHSNNLVETGIVLDREIIDDVTVTMSKTSAELYVGETVQLQVTITPETSTHKVTEWLSSDNKIATVKDGFVEAKAVGSATITARLSNGKTAACIVTVKEKVIEVESVQLNKTTMTMNVGERFELIATILPANASNKTVYWSIDKKIININNGVIEALEPGVVTVTVQSANGKTAKCTITIVNPTIDVQSITLDKTNASIEVGQTVKLTATVLPANATNKTVTWSSSDQTIATVKDGVVTSLKEGTVIISAKAGSKEARCTIFVNEPAPVVNKDELTAKYNELKGIPKGNYTDESYNAFKTALDNAKNTLENSNASQAEVNQSLIDLTVAYAGLKEIEIEVDITDLFDKYDELKGIQKGNYTDESYNAFKAALDNAKNILENSNASQTEVNQALADLTAAYEGLKEKEMIPETDKSALLAKYDEVNGTEKGNYTDESYQAFTNALAAAKLVLANEEAIQEEVDTALANLKAAYAGLKEIEKPVEKPFPFEDVFKGQWYYEYVDQAYQLGLMTGASDSLFKPAVSMNRGMVAIVLHRMEGAEEVAYAPIFPDVYDKQYFTTAVMWAKQTGIITGYNNGTFMPLKNVTREEMATMIQRFAKYKGLDVTSSKDITYFKDYADISTYAKAPIQWCVENGVLSGKFEGTKVDPLGTASRAECAKMLVQAYKVIYK